MLKNVTIKSMLIFVIGFLSLLLVAVGLNGLKDLRNSNGALKTVYEDRVVPLGQLDQIVRNMLSNQIDIADAVGAGTAVFPDKIARVEKRVQLITDVWKEYMATSLEPDEKVHAAKFAEYRAKFVQEAIKPALEAMRSGNTPALQAIVRGPMEASFNNARAEVDELIKIQLAVAKREYEHSQQEYDRDVYVVIGILVAGVTLAIFIGVIMMRAISRPLDEAVRIAKNVAAGDLTQRIEVTSRNETGQLLMALKDMTEGLSRTIGQVRVSTDTIATASSQIAAGNLDLSSRTEQQASSLEETASSMEEMTSTVKQNADNARQANQLAASASEVAVKGGDVVSQVVATMQDINESSKKIVDIIGVIDSIAFQTNILALNAAVEAARAGEQGRGFAVVASEVRTLAQRSASAAKEIKELIGASVEKVESDAKLVDHAGETMHEVVSSIRRVTDIMGEITAASAEQSAGIEQINQAIGQMDQVTQQNAALVEQAAAAAESMQDQAGKLAGAVSVFKVEGMRQLDLVQPAPRKPAVQKPSRPAGKEAVATASQNPAAKLNKIAVADGSKDEWEEF